MNQTKRIDGLYVPRGHYYPPRTLDLREKPNYWGSTYGIIDK